jgi:hypothetical protein
MLRAPFAHAYKKQTGRVEIPTACGELFPGAGCARGSAAFGGLAAKLLLARHQSHTIDRMPLTSDTPPTRSPEEFCAALKAARERKGIQLTDIENETKIPAFLLAALESHDLRRWPKGFFGRSFFQNYVKAIGLPPAETCAEFVRLFPDQEDPDTTRLALPEAQAPAAGTRWQRTLSRIRHTMKVVMQHDVIIAVAWTRRAGALGPRLSVRIKFASPDLDRSPTDVEPESSWQRQPPPAAQQRPSRA